MRPFVFAAGIDWLEGLLPLLFLLFWIISQVVNVVRNVVGRGQPQVPQPAVPGRPRRPEVGRGDDVRANLERQIEEFLAQRAERRVEPAPPSLQPPPSPRPPSPQAPRPQSVRALRDAPRAPESPSRSGREPAAPAQPQGIRQPQAAAANLGSLGSHGGDIARHVRDAFADDLEHRRPRLGKPTVGGPAEPVAAHPPEAHDLVTLLRDPTALRQLFIVREVLDRPVDRWS